MYTAAIKKKKKTPACTSPRCQHGSSVCPPLTPWMQMCHILTTLHVLCHHISWHTSKSITPTYPHRHSHSTNRKARSALLSHRCKQQRQQVKVKSVPSSLSFTCFICRILNKWASMNSQMHESADVNFIHIKYWCVYKSRILCSFEFHF